MKEEVRKTLSILIKEQQVRKERLKTSINSTLRRTRYYYEGEDGKEYTKWLAKVKRFLDVNFPDDKYIEEFETIAAPMYGPNPQQQQQLLAILEAFLEFPEVVGTTKTGKSTKSININNNISNTNTQSQQQSQQQSVEILIKALEDQLTVSQLKDIKQVVEEEKGDLEKAKPKVIDKLKSFGENVASNILANIITNPAIWTLLS
jgi:hypothetical protein|nr:MAG TPA: hypothetical protein [Caudoviricetes sp.]